MAVEHSGMYFVVLFVHSTISPQISRRSFVARGQRYVHRETYGKVHFTGLGSSQPYKVHIFGLGTGARLRWSLNEIHSLIYAEVISTFICYYST